MHYFIDHNKLIDQPLTDTFGIHLTDPTNKYNITSRFQMNNVTKSFD